MEEKLRLGFAFTGSYCTFSRIFPILEEMANKAEITPVFSNNSAETDSRFGLSADFIKRAEEICGKKAITTIAEAEPIGPKKMLDALVIAPCTGNTTAKLANGIADTTVTLAAKSQLRNNRPVDSGIHKRRSGRKCGQHRQADGKEKRLSCPLRTG